MRIYLLIASIILLAATVFVLLTFGKRVIQTVIHMCRKKS